MPIIYLSHDSDNMVSLDVETTGLGSTAEVVQASIVDYESRVLYTSLIKPVVPITDAVSEINGVTNEMLENAPRILDEIYAIAKLLHRKTLVGYNPMFDLRILMQSVAIQHSEFMFPRYFWPSSIIDVCELAVDCMHLRKPLRLTKLTDILLSPNDLPDGRAHQSIYDATVTMRCFRKLIDGDYNTED